MGSCQTDLYNIPLGTSTPRRKANFVSVKFFHGGEIRRPDADNNDAYRESRCLQGKEHELTSSVQHHHSLIHPTHKDTGGE